MTGRATFPGEWLLLALTVALTSRALAAEEPSTFRLSWVRGDGAESCPAARDLTLAVEARLGRDPFAESAREAIEASVTRSGATHWQVQVRVRDAEGKAIGTRDLDTEASDCRAIADAIALAVALAIDPNAALGPVPPPHSTGPAVLPRPEAMSTKACPAVPTCKAPAPCRCPPPERAPTKSTLTGRVMLAGGILPGAAYGAGISGSLGVGRWHATLGGYWLAESEVQGFAFGLSTATADACFDAFHHGSVTLGICAGMELGAMHAVVTAPDLRPTGPGESVWLAAGLGAYLGWRGPGPFYAEVGGALLAPLLRPEFGVSGEAEPRFQPDSVGGIGFLGLGAAVP